MRIDVHAHHYPRELLEAHSRYAGVELPVGRPATLDERVDMLKEVGIDLQVLSVGARQPAFARVEDALSVARLANDLYADMCEGYDGRFAAFATVPLPHVDAAIEEVGRCLDSLGMLGVNLGTSVARRALDDPEFAPFFAELNRRRAVLFLHPCGIGAPMTDAFGLDFLIGACFEDTVTSMRLIMSGMTERYPDVKIIVPHLGGTLPFLLQPVDDGVRRRSSEGEHYDLAKPSDAARRLYYDVVNGSASALRCSCEVVGADHLMLGTDYPFRAIAPSVTYVEEAGLREDEVRTILDETAPRVLGLVAQR